jgi:hypothetical protein
MDHPLMTLWPMWVLTLLFAFTGRHEIAITLLGLPWWHRWLGGVVAAAFFASQLVPLSRVVWDPGAYRAYPGVRALRRLQGISVSLFVSFVPFHPNYLTEDHDFTAL